MRSRDGVVHVLPKKWGNLERQRPRLRFAKWGIAAGVVLTGLGLLGAVTLTFGVVILVGSGIWAYSLLR